MQDRDPQMWPTSARLAIATGLATQIRLWVYLWNADRPRSDGWIDMDDSAQDEMARALGVGRQTLTRWINQGQGGPVRFWQVVTTGDGARKLRYTGQVKLAAALASYAYDQGVRDAYELPRRKQFISYQDLTGSLRQFQAACFAAWISDQTDHRYRATWAILSDLWQRSHVTLGGWADLAGVRRVENVGRVQRPDLTQDDIPAAYALAQTQDNYTWFGSENGAIFQYWQRGNTYIANPNPAARGQATQIQQTLAQADRGDSTDHPAGKLAEVLAQRAPNVQFVSEDRGGLSAVIAALGSGIYRAVIYYQRTNYTPQDAPQDAPGARHLDRYLLAGREIRSTAGKRRRARAVWDLIPVSQNL